MSTSSSSSSASEPIDQDQYNVSIENEWNERRARERMQQYNQPSGRLSPPTSDSILSMSARADLLNSASILTPKQEADMKALSENPHLRELLEVNQSRFCRYCKAKVEGAYDPEHRQNPMKEHLATCYRYQDLLNKQRRSDQAISIVEQLGNDTEALIARRQEIDRAIGNKLYELISMHVDFGDQSSDLSSSIDEYIAKFGEQGEKYKRPEGVSSGINSRRGRIDLVFNIPDDKRELEITCRVEDRLQKWRKQFPELMVSVDTELEELKRGR